MEGFGAALTNSSAYLIHYSRHRDEILQALFGSGGITINYIRLIMGASDFMGQGKAYTYDVNYDPSLSKFSISKDEEFVIPTLLATKKINPSLKIVVSPWSAPSWMKTSKSLYGANFNSSYTDIYGSYWVKFLQAYRDRGINIDTLTLQNEPYWRTSGYPTMYLETDQAARLVKNLGTKLESAGFYTKIWVWDHNWNLVDYPEKVLSDPVAAKFIDGVAFHCYADNYTAPSDVFKKYKTNIYFTECTGTSSDETWPRVFRWNMYRPVFVPCYICTWCRV